jgi:hypothetical protein
VKLLIEFASCRGHLPHILPEVPAEFWQDGRIIIECTDRFNAPTLGEPIFPKGLYCRGFQNIFLPKAIAAPQGVEGQPVPDWPQFVEQLRTWCLDAFLHSYAAPDKLEAVALYNRGAISFETLADEIRIEPYIFNKVLPWLKEDVAPRFDPSEGKHEIIDTTDAADFDPSKLAKRKWVMEPIAHRKLMTLLIATGGSGKSIFAQQLGIAVSLGIDFGPFKSLTSPDVV